MAADNSIKSNSYIYGEYDNQYNNYKIGNPMPQKIHGLFMRYNGLMKFRPTQRLLGEIPYFEGQKAIGFFYSENFKWMIVVTNLGTENNIYIYDIKEDFNDTHIAKFTVDAQPDVVKANFIEIELKFNTLNGAGNTNKNAILVSGLGVNLKYLSVNNTGDITFNDYKINYTTTNTNTPVVRKVELFENRLTLLTTDNQILHSTDSVAIGSNAFEDFTMSTANLNRAFKLVIPLLSGEIIYDICNERRQLSVLSNKGFSITKTLEGNDQYNLDNASFYRIESFPTFPGKVVVFANYAVYPTVMGLRVRAYSQIGTLYTPSMEPGCIPLPTVCQEMLNITSIKNIDESQSMAVIDSGICYFMSYPRKITDDPYMSPAGSIYPRTTYFESDDFEVLDIANNVESLLLKRNSDNKILVTYPDPSKGFMSMFANSFVPSLKILSVRDLQPTGKEVTVENANKDLIKFYLFLENKWYLFTKFTDNIFATNFDTPDITPNESYSIFPASSWDIGELFPRLSEFSNYNWSYSCIFEDNPLHIEGVGNEKSSFNIPNPQNIVNKIYDCVIHRAILPGELVFESDTPPNNPAGSSQVLLVFKEKTKDFLSFNPTPQQDQNLASIKTEKVMSMLKFPVFFSTMTNTTKIEFVPILNNADTTNLTLVRFMYM